MPAADAFDPAILNTLMVEPKKFTSMADLFKALPPEAMAQFATMQKAAAERAGKGLAVAVPLCRRE